VKELHRCYSDLVVPSYHVVIGYRRQLIFHGIYSIDFKLDDLAFLVMVMCVNESVPALCSAKNV